MKYKCLLVLVFINLTLTLYLIIKPINDDKDSLTSHFLQASEELQKVYLDVMVYCGEQNYSARGQYITCMNNEMETYAPTELKSYKRIKQFCRIKEKNECDIENCITDAILHY